MNKANFLNSTCRHCRYFNPEGRRGGSCQKLGVPVNSTWQTCTLARYPFSPTWKSLEEIVHLENSFSYLDRDRVTSASAVKLSTADLTS
ncbi:MAG TPA: hypothetical protein ACFCUY_15820 [Xenococcaceae cyanobacterium]|jgi:hypothetical protein